MISVAILFDHFGPYHLARLQAASVRCNLLAIEVAGLSADYAWEINSARGNYQRVTLFEQTTSNNACRSELIQRLQRELERFKPDVVAVPGWAGPAAWSAMDWCLRRRIPMVCMSESSEADEARSLAKEWVKRKIVGLFSSALVGGDRHREYLIKLGFPQEQIFRGYDAVDNDYFRDQAEKIRASGEEVRRKYGLPRNYFLASARFVGKKNLPRLLEAYALYHSSCKIAVAAPWALVVLGDGVLRPALELQIEKLGLGKHILMPGFKQIADLPGYYAPAGAFIHPSTVEPWGLVVNEAMASGLPVMVSNRCGCVPELVHDGVNGIVIDPLNVEEMALTMRRMAEAEFPRAAFGGKSGEIVSKWGPEKFASGFMQAVEAARTNPSVAATWMGRRVLRMLIRR